MKPIPFHTQSIEIEFSNNGFLLFRATFPHKNKQKDISNWYKRTKLAVASAYGIPVWKIKGSHSMIKSIYFDRILFEWAGGMAVNMPDDVDSYDMKIILHYLEGLKMACK